MMILFFGPDGAGKTTLARMLKRYLMKQGKYKVKVSWIRGTHMLALIIASFFSKFNTMRGEDNPYFGIKIKRRDRIWQFIEFISLLPRILIEYYIPHKVGYVVIGERSPIDSLVWIIATTRDSQFLKTICGKLLLAFSNSANKLVFVTAKQDILVERRMSEGINTKFIETQVFLYEKIHKILRESSLRAKVYRLDTSDKNVYDSFTEVISIVYGMRWGL
jgi:thymidylate kinase